MSVNMAICMEVALQIWHLEVFVLISWVTFGIASMSARQAHQQRLQQGLAVERSEESIAS